MRCARVKRRSWRTKRRHPRAKQRPLSCVGVVFGLDIELSAGLLRQEVAADEGINVPVEDAIHVAHLELGAVVLDQAIRLENVRANLAAEADLELRGVEL